MNAERFYSEPGIGDSRRFERQASMDRANRVRRDVVNVGLGMLFGFFLLLMMTAPWDRLQ